MSSPPLKAPRLVRWLSLLVVVAAIAVRYWPHHDAPTAPHRTASAPAAASASRGAAHASRFDASIGFRTRELLEEHFGKHGADFHADSPARYLALAQALRDRDAGGDVREMVRADGVISRFDRVSGAFIAFEQDGTIRTFFTPNDGERYFERQAARPHGGE